MPLRFTMLLVLTKAFLRSPAPRATRRVVARAATKSTNGGEWALPDGWRAALGDELASDRFRDLRAFVAAERASHTVYPPPEQTLRALRSVDLERVRVCGIDRTGRVRSLGIVEDPHDVKEGLDGTEIREKRRRTLVRGPGGETGRVEDVDCGEGLLLRYQLQ